MRERIFVMMCVLSISVIVSAQEAKIDLSGLNTEQVKALTAAAAELRKQPANTIANLTLQNTTPERFREWASAGQEAGKAVSNFTKEIGVGADAFLKTDVGRIGLYTLIWKFGGDKVAESLFNIGLKVILAILLYTFWWKLTRRFVFNERHKTNISYNENTFLRWLGFNKKEIAWEKDDMWMQGLGEEARAWILILTRGFSAALLVIITLICWPTVSF